MGFASGLTWCFLPFSPFFAMSEIMIGLGVVHFMGVLVEPIMRPVFRIPGEGAFAVVMGLASGYPCRCQNYSPPVSGGNV